MRSRLTVFTLFFLSLFSLSQLRAEPADVLVGNLTFTRPQNWKWQEPPKASSAVSRFMILDTGDAVSQTEVRFYIIKKEVSSERQGLLQQFPQASATDLHEQQIKIGKQKIVYFTIAGTYQFKNGKPRPDQLWVGAAIPSGKQFVYARLQGPRSETEKCISVFKQMVENAVKERDVN
jgi:hypothetical protein